MPLTFSLRKYRKTCIILTVAGVVVAFVGRGGLGLGQEIFSLRFLSDMFFSIALVFFAWAMIHVLGNMNMFASMIYGTKCLMKMIKGKAEDGETMHENYVEYLKSRRKHGDIPVLFIFSGAFLVLSLIVALIQL